LTLVTGEKRVTAFRSAGLLPGLGSYIAEPVVRRNAHRSLVDGMFYSAMLGFTLPFLGVCVLRLGGSDYDVGLLSSLPALVGMASQLPAAALVGRYASRLRATLHYALAHRLFYLAMALLVLAPPWWTGRARLLVAAYALASFPATVCGVAWTAMVGEMFPPRLRGQIFGDRNMMTTLASLGATAVAGPFLDRVTFPANYSALFLASFVCLMLSWVYLARLEEEPRPPTAARAGSTRVRVVQALSTLAHGDFRRFTLAAFVFHLGFHLPAALFPLLFVKELGFSTSWIGNFAVVAGVLAAFTFRWWGRVADRGGNRRALVWSSLGFVALPVLYGLVSSPWAVLVLMAAGGVAGAGFGLVLFNALLEQSPAEGREDYVAVFNMFMGLTACVMPLAGVALCQRSGYLAVFALSSLVRVAGVVLLAGSGGRTAGSGWWRSRRAGAGLGS
jgi:MFS family permease